MNRRKIKDYNIAPDEIFLDNRNLPSLDDHQFEGRLERPISKLVLTVAGLFFVFVSLAFLGRIAYLQVISGADYALRSSSNNLRHTIIMPPRGIIYDRNKTELAWNNPARTYIASSGFSHVLGYLGLPTDKELSATNTITHEEQIGRAGAESEFNNLLTGTKGVKIEEVNVRGDVISDYSLQPAQSGQSINLSIDAKLQSKLFEVVKAVADDRGFSGGAGVIMDVRTGELLALVSYPEYDSNLMTSRSDKVAIGKLLTAKNTPFLNRAVGGLYAPGSVFKPIVAIGALNENIISPDKQILSVGQLEIPNPYNPKEKTIFKDWKAHGWVDMRDAIAQSSDEYFYQIGGGYQGQKGLGILNIEKYAKMFGLSQTTGIELENEADGTIPSPEWKAANFDGEAWRLGDTYHTAIGQYGVLVTPLQIARVIATIANGGSLLKPTILLKSETDQSSGEKVSISTEDFQVVREGMRLCVTSVEGTGHGLDLLSPSIAAKTGTAELGVSKASVNSWVTGFWPYENPHYAFAVVMEKGSRHNTIGGVFVMRSFFEWLAIYEAEYLE